MDQLLQQKVVNDSTFSFYLTSDTSGTDSFIDLGGYVEENIRKGEKITWFTMMPNFYWVAASVTGVKFDSTAYKFNQALAVIFDSGTSLTMVPGSIYDQFLQQIINRIPPWVEYQFD